MNERTPQSRPDLEDSYLAFENGFESIFLLGFKESYTAGFSLCVENFAGFHVDPYASFLFHLSSLKVHMQLSNPHLLFMFILQYGKVFNFHYTVQDTWDTGACSRLNTADLEKEHCMNVFPFLSFPLFFFFFFFYLSDIFSLLVLPTQGVPYVMDQNSNQKGNFRLLELTLVLCM